ncbi:MAG: WS/DGAT/MGAT family O-acyltransferase [Solirubrobacterales bacterium]
MGEDRLTGLDASFLDFERGGAHMHVASTLIFRGATPSYEDFVDHVASRLHLVPRFRQKLRFVPLGQGRPVWVDDPELNLEYHLRHTALPAPGTDDQLRVLGSRIMSQRLDRSKPLWELWLVDGLADDRFAIIGKSHHALVDGVSGIDITTVLFDAAEEPAPIPEPQPWSPAPEPSDVQLLAESVKRVIRDPRRLLGAAKDVLAAPSRVLGPLRQGTTAAGSFLGSGLSAPRSVLNVDIGPHRRLAWVRAELDDFKVIKNAHGGTVNDVILAAVTGALGGYLRGRGQATGELELRALVPISTRGEDEHGTLGNRISAMMAPLPVWSEDPVEQLRLISARMGDLKGSRQAVGAGVLTELADFAPATIVSQAARLQARQRFFNLVVTNVPGPQVPLYLLGRRLEAVFPMVPLAARQTVSIGIMSYDGGLFFGLVGDLDAMPGLDALAAELERSIAELLSLSPPSDGGRERRARAAERPRSPA